MRMDLLSNRSIKSLSPSFNNLPSTNHKDGQYRLRRYSQIELQQGWPVPQSIFKVLPVNTFEQGGDYNDFQGDIERTFEQIDDSSIYSEGMEELILLFKDTNRLSSGTVIDIHQMRVITLHNDTQVSPEGVHRDGYDCISMAGISRHNVTGGHLLVYANKDGEYFLSVPLNAGQVITLDDSKLWHNASPIQPVDPSKLGYIDAFILTARL